VTGAAPHSVAACSAGATRHDRDEPALLLVQIVERRRTAEQLVLDPTRGRVDRRAVLAGMAAASVRSGRAYVSTGGATWIRTRPRSVNGWLRRVLS